MRPSVVSCAFLSFLEPSLATMKTSQSMGGHVEERQANPGAENALVSPASINRTWARLAELPRQCTDSPPGLNVYCCTPLRFSWLFFHAIYLWQQQTDVSLWVFFTIIILLNRQRAEEEREILWAGRLTAAQADRAPWSSRSWTGEMEKVEAGRRRQHLLNLQLWPSLTSVVFQFC